MSEVLMFHHVHGLTDGVRALADRLRQAGHVVHLPDLYDGQVFADLDDGMAHLREVGFDALLARGTAVAQELSAELVYAGLSLGVAPAQQLAQTRAGGRGALLLHGCLPVSEFGGAWPAGVPVQVHAMDADPYFVEDGGDLDAARALVASASEAELFLYPGDQHLFSDSSLPAYDEASAELMLQRVLAFLDRR